MYKKNSAFSIIEVLIGIFIFSMGLVSVYALMASSIRLTDYNKNFIIASNLSTEGIELVRNMRDRNYKKFYPWDVINHDDITQRFYEGIFAIEDKLLNGEYELGDGLDVSEISDFSEDISELNQKMEEYRLYRTSDGLYTYEQGINEKTNFYRYVKFEPVTYEDSGTQTIDNAWKVTSKVLWYHRNFHEFEVSTILADFKKL